MMENSSGEKKKFSDVLHGRGLRLRRINCFDLTQRQSPLCVKLDYSNREKSRLRFVVVEGSTKESQVYHYTSPLTAEYVHVKLEKFLESKNVIYHHGTVRDLMRHHLITKMNRTLIVLESSNQEVIKLFEIQASLMKEKYDAFVVFEKDPAYGGKQHYDNCYIIGPNDYIHRYLIPTTPEIINQITLLEI